MKKIIFSLFILVTIILEAGAQGFHFGPQVSLNLSSLSNMGHDGIGYTEPRTKTGLALGGFAEYDFNNWIGIQGDLMYSRQGVVLGSGRIYHGDEEVEEDPGKVSIKLHYLNIPIKVKFTIRDKVFAYAGPQIGFCLGAKSKKEDASVNISSEVNGVDIGAIMGAGWQFKFGLNLGISYYIGFSNVFKEAGNTSKNRVFAITAGWKF